MSVVSICLVYILVLWPRALQYKLPASFFLGFFLFVLILWFVVVLSGEPKQKQGRGFVDRHLVQPPVILLLAAPRRFLFWFFGGFGCSV